MRPALRALSFLMPGKAKGFRVRELADAKAWLAAEYGAGVTPDEPRRAGGSRTGSGRRLAVLLAMAMFVLVVDTSLMNVSIAKVVEDLDTTVSGVQGAIALEALGVGRVHPDREQGRRPHRAQAGLRPRAARLRARRPGDGALPGPHGDHRVLGHHRRARRVAAAARDAVADPRQLPGRGPEEGLRAGGRRGGDRRGRRAAGRRLPDDLPVVARRDSCWRSW